MNETKRKKLRRQGGFTLTEIMVSVFIVGLLSTAVVLSVAPMIGQSRETKARADITTISNALDQFNLEMFDFPTERQGLEALVTQPEGIPAGASYRPGGYIRKLSDDPWGRPYLYKRPGVKSGRAYDLYSLGADGAEGGEELDADIGNWN